jgi:hypothetical protein
MGRASKLKWKKWGGVVEGMRVVADEISKKTYY